MLVILLLIANVRLNLRGRALKNHDRFVSRRMARDSGASFKTNLDVV